MALPLTINGAVFEYPQNFDEDWGVDATGWAQAVTNGALYLSGGNFPLTNTVDFGSSFGIKVKSILTETASPSTSGYIALAHADTIGWRNQLGNGNLLLSVDSSNMLNFNGTPLGLTSLTNGDIYVGNASNVPVAVALSGDATLTNTGVMTIANSAITNAKVSATAAIATSKLAPLSASLAVTTDSGGLLTNSNVTALELSQLAGISTGTSVQAQIDAHLPLSGGTMSGAISMASHKITALTAGSNTGEAVEYSQIAGMRILQIVNNPGTSNTTTTSSSTYTACTGMSVTITPHSAASQIIIFVSGSINNSAAGSTTAYVTLFRGASDLGRGDGTGFTSVVATGGVILVAPVAFIIPDSPATTSAVTYQIYIKSSSNANAISWAAQGLGSITAIEIG